MAGGRFVVLGLAQARSPWFRAVAQWSNSASIPVEFVKCMSPSELRAHLASGRSFSALLVDGGLPGLDRDLVQETRDAGCAVLVVDDLRVSRDWRGLGANAVINPVLERKDLLDLLAEYAVEIGRADTVVEDEGPTAGVRRARVAMVCGPGGTGASTAAIALAQGLGDNPRYGGMVLLADLALHAEQAMLHDARDVVPGIQELVDAFRTGRPGESDIRNLTFDVQERRYHLLLGLRRSRNWPAVRPRTFAAAFDGLVQSWHALVCDCDADLEGEDDTGSIDLEERNLMTRTAAAQADVVLCVGLPGMKGIHALVRVVGDLLDHGVPAGRVVPVVNRAPKGARQRAEITVAVAQLLRGRGSGDGLATPVFLPERRVDEALRDMVRLPSALTAPLIGAFEAVTRRVGAGREAEELRPVVPGTLGHWSADVTAETA
ncbi:MAG TPA: hypothetical protein VFO65_02245 [Acidimicrobiales bacterium]|nr:hypothetical protein [Acidimicrobiales bacterium]